MASVEIITNIESVIFELNAMQERLHSELRVAEMGIMTEMQAELVRAYGNKLAARWQTEGTIQPDNGILARFHVWTVDPYVYGYEFGTRPHMIMPSTPNGVLRFTTSGGVVFTRSAQHPGTTGKQRREQIATHIAIITERLWREALATVLT